MYLRILIAGMALLGGIGTASADQYYVVRDPQTKHCTVVTEQPRERTVVRQIGPIAFATREEAEGRIKEYCNNEDDDDDDDDSSSTTVIERR